MWIRILQKSKKCKLIADLSITIYKIFSQVPGDTLDIQCNLLDTYQKMLDTYQNVLDTYVFCSQMTYEWVKGHSVCVE